MSIRRAPLSSLAFGVEPGQLPYRLRQARYHALAEDVAERAAAARAAGQPPLKLVDVGVYNGVSRRYIEAHPSAKHIEWHGVDIFPHGRELVYRHDEWTLHEIDLERGLAPLPADHFDIVICEQVLEHLHAVEQAAGELVRILRPGGLLIAGVPIFPFGFHHVRRHVVPRLDKLLGTKKVRGHVQAFSLASFEELLAASGPLRIDAARGFRIVSGGPLRNLEHYRWWWRLNRQLGSWLPAWCVETQVLATKTRASEAAPRTGRFQRAA